MPASAEPPRHAKRFPKKQASRQRIPSLYPTGNLRRPALRSTSVVRNPPSRTEPLTDPTWTKTP